MVSAIFPQQWESAHGTPCVCPPEDEATLTYGGGRKQVSRAVGGSGYRGFFSEATQEMLEVPMKPQREAPQIFISSFPMGLLSQALWIINVLLVPAFA